MVDDVSVNSDVSLTATPFTSQLEQRKTIGNSKMSIA